MANKYYNVYLNNNIFRCTIDYHVCDNVFTNEDINKDIILEPTYKFKQKISVENNPIQSLFGIKTDVVPLNYIYIIGYEKDDKIYDLITGKELKFSKKYEAKYTDELTYYYLKEINILKVAEEIEKLSSWQTNLDAYRQRIEYIEEEVKKVHINYLENKQSLVRKK